MILNYEVKNEKMTINHILKSELKVSSNLFTKLIKNNLVLLNGSTCDTRYQAHIGDKISIDLSFPEDNSNIIPTKMDLEIIFEDPSFIILNKPAGIAIHPSILHYDDTLANGLKFYYDTIHLPKKIRPVNRLDTNTSGLVVFAKNEYVQEKFIQQMVNHTFQKEYLAIVIGTLLEKKGTIQKPIARKDGSIIERCISSSGKKAITHFEVLKEWKDYSFVKCLLETGRTHQIRVHFASIGHPLLGDELYGKKSDLIKGQALNCYHLSFQHPITNENLTFELSSNPFPFSDYF